MKITIEITEEDLKRLAVKELSEKTNLEISEADVRFEVKASMNYKSEWETGKFRATINKSA